MNFFCLHNVHSILETLLTDISDLIPDKKLQLKLHMAKREKKWKAHFQRNLKVMSESLYINKQN